MESKNRGLLIFVLLVVALALVGCCALAAVAGLVAPWRVERAFSWADLPSIRLDLPGSQTERIEKTFEVDSAPRLSIDNFAGSVTIRPGEDGSIHVVATKRARSANDLETIEVEMGGQAACCLEIKTSHPALPNISDASVKLEVTVPADTALNVHTGAGSIDIRDVRGSLRVAAGAGSIQIRGAAGAVSLNSGAGSIDYEGNPLGECSFTTGVGSITLQLPADANLAVDLSAGLGSVHSEFDLEAGDRFARRWVRGTIGTGGEGKITGSAGVGGIDLRRE